MQWLCSPAALLTWGSRTTPGTRNAQSGMCGAFYVQQRHCSERFQLVWGFFLFSSCFLQAHGSRHYSMQAARLAAPVRAFWGALGRRGHLFAR